MSEIEQALDIMRADAIKHGRVYIVPSADRMERLKPVIDDDGTIRWYELYWDWE